MKNTLIELVRVWHPCRDAGTFAGRNRGCRCAQSPANGWDPSGIPGWWELQPIAWPAASRSDAPKDPGGITTIILPKDPTTDPGVITTLTPQRIPQQIPEGSPLAAKRSHNRSRRDHSH